MPAMSKFRLVDIIGKVVLFWFLVWKTGINHYIRAFMHSFYKEHGFYVRDAAKKVIFLVVRPLRPPLELKGHRTFFIYLFSLKIAENGFLPKKNVWTKRAKFVAKYWKTC